MGPFEAGFLAISAFTVVSALGVILSREIVRAAGYLIVALLGVGATFALMGSLFVASIQVLVYAGAVIILFLFGVMLTRSPKPASRLRRLMTPENLGYTLFAIALLAVLVYPLIVSGFGSQPMQPVQLPSVATSVALFKTFKGALYAIAALTATSALGAIYIVKKPRSDRSK
ncbi:MAG: NADH-quinone oxidoreductase subunit J [Thermoprotei archaeon]